MGTLTRNFQVFFSGINLRTNACTFLSNFPLQSLLSIYYTCAHKYTFIICIILFTACVCVSVLQYLHLHQYVQYVFAPFCGEHLLVWIRTCACRYFISNAFFCAFFCALCDLYFEVKKIFGEQCRIRPLSKEEKI